MKRSSSKLISKAGSVRNINKVGFKFNYELHIESVTQMLGSNDVVATWERGSKILSTRPAKIDKTSRVAHFGGQVLSQEVTLFKKKKENAAFDPKVYRLTIRQASERGKVIGKIEVDFADYVQIPSFDKRIGASLSSGGRLVLRVSSTYIGEAKGKSGSRGSASVGSRDPESDGVSSAAPDDDVASELDADLPDFDDISIDEEPQYPATMHALPPTQPAVKKAGSLRGRRGARASGEDSPSGGLLSKVGRKKSSASPKRDAGSSGRLLVDGLRGRGKAEGDVGATNGAVSRAEFDKIRRENRMLGRKVEDLEMRNEELERKVEEKAELEGGVESLEELVVENTALRRDVVDLEARLAREPVYADVVRDLRETKMALAIVTLEKDELSQQVRKMRKR